MRNLGRWNVVRQNGRPTWQVAYSRYQESVWPPYAAVCNSKSTALPSRTTCFLSRTELGLGARRCSSHPFDFGVPGRCWVRSSQTNWVIILWPAHRRPASTVLEWLRAGYCAAAEVRFHLGRVSHTLVSAHLSKTFWLRSQCRYDDEAS